MKKVMLGCSLAFVLFVGVILYCLNQGSGGWCGNDVVQNVLSPDGHLRAVVFERDCGATTSFSTQVSVLGARANLPDAPGNVFIADGGTAPPAAKHTIAMKVRWNGARRLLLRYDTRAEVIMQRGNALVWLRPLHGEWVSVQYDKAEGY